MTRVVTIALLALLFAGCAGSPADHTATRSVPVPSVNNAMQGLALPGLPGDHAASTMYGDWNIYASEFANFALGEIVLEPLPGDWGWAIVDLGEQHPALDITQIYFPDSTDWTLEDPDAHAWVGLSNYTKGTWLWAPRREATDGPEVPVDFSNVPDGTQFFQNLDPGHAYMALVTDHHHVNFGTFAKVKLEPVVHLYEPPLSVEAGEHNKFLWNPVTGEGNIVTYCSNPSQNGGALVRFTLDSELNIDWTVTNLYQSGQALQNSIRYDIDYTDTGKLVIAAARTEPAPVIRLVTESNVAGQFDIPDTAVDTENLPNPYTDPHLAMDLDNTNNPHIVFADVDGTLRYVFRVSGSWALTGGGYTDGSRYPDIVCRNSDIISAFCDDSGAVSGLSIGSHPISLPGDPWDAKRSLFLEPPKNGGNYVNMMVGPDSRILITHTIKSSQITPGGIPPGLAISYSEAGIITGTWENQSVDTGKDATSGGTYTAGAWASLALLRDGTPVISYYAAGEGGLPDALRMAVGSTVNGGPDWYKFVVDDDEVPSRLGEYTAVDVIHGTGSEPDLIGVAYGDTTSGASNLRFAIVEWPY